MGAIRTISRRLLAEEQGATAVEYGLIASLIVIAVIGGMSALGGGAGGMWSELGNTVSTYLS